MSETTETIWTCERCGAVARTSAGHRPKGWIDVSFAHPIRHHDRQFIADLCKRCERWLYDFVTGKDAEAVRRDMQLLDRLEAVEASLNASHQAELDKR